MPYSLVMSMVSSRSLFLRARKSRPVGLAERICIFEKTKAPTMSKPKKGNAGPDETLPPNILPTTNSNCQISPTTLTHDQYAIVQYVLQCFDSGASSFTFIHALGGAGKSFTMRRIVHEMENRGKKTVSMCPTGVGAGELTRGRTLYTGLMIWLPKELSMDDISKLKITFDETVGLIIVDEVSMFSAQHFNLLDHRL